MRSDSCRFAIVMLVAACDSAPSPVGVSTTDHAKWISASGVTDLLYQNDVHLALESAGSWDFEPGAVSEMQIVKVVEKSGDEYPFTAVVRFVVTLGGAQYDVEGWITYKQSEAYPELMKRADHDWYRTIRVDRR